jgi:hypothetical protein
LSQVADHCKCSRGWLFDWTHPAWPANRRASRGRSTAIPKHPYPARRLPVRYRSGRPQKTRANPRVKAPILVPDIRVPGVRGIGLSDDSTSTPHCSLARLCIRCTVETDRWFYSGQTRSFSSSSRWISTGSFACGRKRPLPLRSSSSGSVYRPVSLSFRGCV